MRNKRKTPDPPDSLQKGLLQLLWTARPWVRNTLLILAGAIALLVTLVPPDMREAAMRSMLHMREPSDSPATPDLEDENSHVLRLANGHLVRLIGKVRHNDSNVSDLVIQHAVESDAWRYNHYCYNEAFGRGKLPPPAGTVIVDFDITDQLPTHVKVTSSTFASEQLGNCIVQILDDYSINEAGSQVRGHVSYEFKFKPN